MVDKAKQPRPRLQSLERKVTTIETKRGCNAIVRIVGRKLQQIRDRILFRDEYTCQKCGQVTIDLEVDHITPLGDGGRESDANRQCLCKQCHIKKTAKELFNKGLISNVDGYIGSHNAEKTLTI